MTLPRFVSANISKLRRQQRQHDLLQTLLSIMSLAVQETSDKLLVLIINKYVSKSRSHFVNNNIVVDLCTIVLKVFQPSCLYLCFLKVSCDLLHRTGL